MCSIEGCDGQVVARGLCKNHYGRWRRYGDPTGGRPSPGSPVCRNGHDRATTPQGKKGNCLRCKKESFARRDPGRVKARARQAAWRAANPEKEKARARERYPDRLKDSVIKARYRISPASYVAILAKGCAICGSHDRVVLDHDHACCPGISSCGRCVRGALCSNHNWALGLFGDDTGQLLAAVDYLTQRRVRQLRLAV
jgi:hypothetical protein